MGFYSRILFPLAYDSLVSSPMKDKARRALLSGVKGEILEIGFGTGLNLPNYPSHVKKVTAVDRNASMNARAEKRIKGASIIVDSYVLNAESLPMKNDTFDSVVTTYTLCTINNIDSALTEVYRVLKPGGRFFFLEHGLSNDPKIQKWQYRLNPIQSFFVDGCRLTRNIRHLIEQADFNLLELDEYYIDDDSKVHGYTYQGVAEKAK
ncbi:MAG: class I SAM-dependent methyltransferase [Deltaproteobacteria bacterium]|nr:class I SAM-dependent methyltransferase [Deltaproteobacteria bacterium]